MDRWTDKAGCSCSCSTVRDWIALYLALFLGHLINASNLMLLLGDLIYFKIAIIIDAGGI